jgi:multiple sugar transport system permease protein
LISLHKKKTIGVSEARLGYMLVAPALFCILMIAIYPILKTLSLSLYSMNLQSPSDTKFIGLDNFKTLLSDLRFLSAFWNTIKFTVCSVAFELCVGMVMALLMNMKLKGTGVIRAAVLVPWAIPTSVSALMWMFMYNDQYGVVNDILTKLGIISKNVAWLGQASTAMKAMIFTDVWKTSPFMGLLLLAGLQGISSDIYEASAVDGASKIRQFFSITLPLLKPTMLVALIFRTIEAFRVFDIVFVMTGGGPGNSTETLSLYAYKTIFRNLDFGMGSAVAVVIFLFVLVFAFVYIRVLGKDTL